MADQKISELNAITGANTADDDLFVIVDTSTNETKKIAKSELVSTINAALVDGAPTTLDTLNELAAALNDDANFATTVTNSLAGKVDTSGDSMTGDLSFGDNDKAIFGAGSDLQIYHDGSNSYITDVGTGGLILGGNFVSIRKDDLVEQQILGFADSSVNIYYDGAQKLATTSTGIDVTGTATMDGLTVDGFIALTDSGSSDRNVLYLDGVTDDVIIATATTAGSRGVKLITGNTPSFYASEGGDISFYEDTGTTAKFYWDASAESLGIGTTTPAYNLHVKGSGSTYIKNESSLGNSILIGATSSGANRIYSRDASDGNNPLEFIVGATERMRIDSSGNLLVGKTAVNYNNNGTGLLSTGEAQFTATNVNPLEINRKGTDGTIVSFRKDGTTVGSIGSNGGNLYFTKPGQAGIRLGAVAVNPCDSNGNALDNFANLGASGERWKDLYLSGGVYLGGTGSANYLDDYEEGTWTPTFISGGGCFSSVSGISSYSANRYIKIGNQVTLWGKVGLNSSVSNSEGVLRLGGLPFSPSFNGSTQDFGCGTAQLYGSHGSSNSDVMSAGCNTGPEIIIYRGTVNGTTAGNVHFFVTYSVA